MKRRSFLECVAGLMGLGFLKKEKKEEIIYKAHIPDCLVIEGVIITSELNRNQDSFDLNGIHFPVTHHCQKMKAGCKAEAFVHSVSMESKWAGLS